MDTNVVLFMRTNEVSFLHIVSVSHKIGTIYDVKRNRERAFPEENQGTCTNWEESGIHCMRKQHPRCRNLDSWLKFSSFVTVCKVSH